MSNSKVGIVLVLTALNQASHTINAMANSHSRQLQELQAQSQQLASESLARSAQLAAGGYAMLKPIKDSVDAAVEFETGMMGVRRQVEGLNSAEAMHQIKKEILDTSELLPITIGQIQDLYTEGGKNGIAREQLRAFATDITSISTALELSTEDAGNSMAGLALLFNKPIGAIMEMGDSINYLDDKSRSTGAGIIEVLNRSAGVMSRFLNFDQSSALASTFLSLQETPERAATAITELFTTLGAAGTQSTKAQAAFAYLGLNAQKLQKDMTIDAQGTILDVLERINKVPVDKQSSILAMLFGQEHIAKIQKLAAHTEEYRGQLQLVNGAQKGSMDREYQVRLQSISAQQQIMNNQLDATAIALGDTQTAAYKDLIDIVTSAATMVRNFALEHPTLTKYIGYTTAGVGGLFLSMSALNFIVGTYATTRAILTGNYVAANAVTALNTTATVANTAATNIASAATTRAAVAQRVLGTAMKTVPWILIATLAIAAIMYIYNNWGAISAWFKKLWARVKEIFASVWQGIKKIFLNYTVAGLIFKNWDKITAYFTDLWDKVKKTFTNVWQWIKGLTTDFWNAGSNIVSSIWEGMKSMASKPVEAIKDIMKKVRDYLPFSPAKVGPLRDIHRIRLVETIAGSIKPNALISKWDGTMGAFGSKLKQPSVRPILGGAGASAGGSFNATFNITVNGNPTKNEVNMLTAEMKKQLNVWYNDMVKNKQRIAF